MPLPYTSRARGTAFRRGPTGLLSDVPIRIDEEQSLVVQGARETLGEVARWVDVCPPWGVSFDRGAEITLASAAVSSEIISFQVSPGEVGVLRWVGNQCQTLADLEWVTFSVLRDGAGVPGYTNFCGLKGVGSERLDELVVALMPGQTISVVASNTAGIALPGVAARIKGWTWNPSMEPRE